MLLIWYVKKISTLLRQEESTTKIQQQDETGTQNRSQTDTPNRTPTSTWHHFWTQIFLNLILFPPNPSSFSNVCVLVVIVFQLKTQRKLKSEGGEGESAGVYNRETRVSNFWVLSSLFSEIGPLQGVFDFWFCPRWRRRKLPWFFLGCQL